MNLKPTLLLVLALIVNTPLARVLTHSVKESSDPKPERKLLSFASTATKQAAYEKLMCWLISPKETQ